MNEKTNFKYINLSPFKWFVLENFPFLEADFDALTEWQLFCKLGKEINKIIESQNLVGKQAEELTNAFNNLQNYVNNYFENLDIQEEINKKLNEMVEDGTLQQIMNQFITNCIASFDTVEKLKNCDFLTNGSKAKTFGYHELNDGGGASYSITNILPENHYGSITLNNGLYAILNETEPNLKQFGAINSKSVDQADFLLEAINYCNYFNYDKLILNGEYFINKTINVSNIENLIIENGTLYVHETDELLNTNFNILFFNNCNNITINNVRIIETNPVARNRKLKVGSIYFNSCNYCKITNSYFENLMTSIIFDSITKNSLIDNNTILVNFQSQQFAQSAILIYSSQNNVISNNKIFGEYYDGTLSIFGGSSTNNIVKSNEINNIIAGTTPTYLSQGITIDQRSKIYYCY